MGVMRTKTIEESIKETEDPEFQLKKKLSALDLTVFGIGVVMLVALTIFLATLIGRIAAGHMWVGALVTGVGEAVAVVLHLGHTSW